MQRYEKDNLPTLTDVRKLLRETVLEIDFQKRNGDIRKMIATLQPDFLPDQTGNYASEEIQQDTNVVTVWDLEEQNWRAFRMDSVVSIEHD